MKYKITCIVATNILAVSFATAAPTTTKPEAGNTIVHTLLRTHRAKLLLERNNTYILAIRRANLVRTQLANTANKTLVVVHNNTLGVTLRSGGFKSTLSGHLTATYYKQRGGIDTAINILGGEVTYNMFYLKFTPYADRNGNKPILKTGRINNVQIFINKTACNNLVFFSQKFINEYCSSNSS